MQNMPLQSYVSVPVKLPNGEYIYLKVPMEAVEDLANTCVRDYDKLVEQMNQTKLDC